MRHILIAQNGLGRWCRFDLSTTFCSARRHGTLVEWNREAADDAPARCDRLPLPHLQPALPSRCASTLLPEAASPNDYRALHRRLGTTRGVVIQPSAYGTDNRLQLASRQALGAESFRIVAVVAEDVPDAKLQRLHEQGVRGVRFIRGLLYKGRTWVKLSGPYVSSRGAPPDYAEAGAVVAAYVKAAPEQLVWRSDWPHPTEKRSYKPDDARLVDLFAEWAGRNATFKRILVDNPAELYGFPPVTP
eukprot:gene12516-12604_t